MEVAEQRHVGTYAHLCAQLIAESKDSGLVVLRQGEHTWEAVREHVLAQEAREHAAGVGLFPHLWERMHVYVHEAPPGPPMVPDDPCCEGGWADAEPLPRHLGMADRGSLTMG